MQPVLRNIGDNMSKKMTGRLTKEQSNIKDSIKGLIYTLFQQSGTWDDEEFTVFHSSRSLFTDRSEFEAWLENDCGGRIMLIFEKLEAMDLESKKRLYKAVKV